MAYDCRHPRLYAPKMGSAHCQPWSRGGRTGLLQGWSPAPGPSTWEGGKSPALGREDVASHLYLSARPAGGLCARLAPCLRQGFLRATWSVMGRQEGLAPLEGHGIAPVPRLQGMSRPPSGTTVPGRSRKILRPPFRGHPSQGATPEDHRKHGGTGSDPRAGRSSVLKRRAPLAGNPGWSLPH